VTMESTSDFSRALYQDYHRNLLSIIIKEDSISHQASMDLFRSSEIMNDLLSIIIKEDSISH
jgi:hypothetical protein